MRNFESSVDNAFYRLSYLRGFLTSSQMGGVGSTFLEDIPSFHRTLRARTSSNFALNNFILLCARTVSIFALDAFCLTVENTTVTSWSLYMSAILGATSYIAPPMSLVCCENDKWLVAIRPFILCFQFQQPWLSKWNVSKCTK